MAEKGAYSPEQIYDEETIDEVIKYAGEVSRSDANDNKLGVTSYALLGRSEASTSSSKSTSPVTPPPSTTPTPPSSPPTPFNPGKNSLPPRRRVK